MQSRLNRASKSTFAGRSCAVVDISCSHGGSEAGVVTIQRPLSDAYNRVPWLDGGSEMADLVDGNIQLYWAASNEMAAQGRSMSWKDGSRCSYLGRILSVM